jgi:protein-tyrosine phosphatase
MATATAVTVEARDTTSGSPQWGTSIVWLAFVGPFFFLSYWFSNWVSSHRTRVPSVMFDWEQQMPFIPWTIVPYWTSDLLYILSIFVCTTKREVNLHGRRLLAIQLISIACFLAFPLRCVFDRPPAPGFFGWLFDVLLGFDKPFNQAPSLHVSLAVILWFRFEAHLDGFWKSLMSAWLMLIVISTMTTHQHQFIDLPLGALAGLLVVALFPDESLPQRFRLATFYLSGAVLAIAIAVKVQGVGWVLLWPAAAMLVVTLAYFADWPELFGLPLVPLIAAPYTLAAWINSRWWTRSQPPAQEIADGVWLGRAPGWFSSEARRHRTIVNVAAEFDGGRRVPMLDLVTPSDRQLQRAVTAIEECAPRRPTLVCCALGYSRSAAAVAAWLESTGRAESMEDAAALVRERRPHVVIDADEF